MLSKGFSFFFQKLLSEDISSLQNFNKCECGQIEFYLLGHLYSHTIDELSSNYCKIGVAALKSVDGDFTLIIKEDKSIKVYRDRHGVGSQVYYNEEMITSHLINFPKDGNVEIVPDYESLLTFMSIGYIPSPYTALQGVKKLGAGCLLTYKNGSIEIADLYTWENYLSTATQLKITEDEAAEEYERLHKKAILSRIRSAPKVGLLLSGGYDSAGNISALRDVYQGDVVSYSIGFKNNQWTELPLAKLLSERYQSRHFEYEIDGSEKMSLPTLLKETGDPFQEGGLMVNYCAMQLVKSSGEDPAVILGGDGNDQHFGTSGKELALHWKLKKNGFQIFQKLFNDLGNRIPYFEGDNIGFRAEFHNRKILHIQQSDMFGFQLYELNRLNKVNQRLSGFRYDTPINNLNESFNTFFLSRNFNIDIKQVINEVILFKSSRMSELFGNRMSFPYMSTELFDFINKLPIEYKFKGSLDDLAKGRGISKFIHKRYLEERLPKEITDRKKQGGFAPLPTFFQDHKQRSQLINYIRSSKAINHLFDKTKINDILKEYDNLVNSSPYWFWHRQVKANQINSLLTLAVWWDVFLERKFDVNTIDELF